MISTIWNGKACKITVRVFGSQITLSKEGLIAKGRKSPSEISRWGSLHSVSENVISCRLGPHGGCNHTAGQLWLLRQSYNGLNLSICLRHSASRLLLRSWPTEVTPELLKRDLGMFSVDLSIHLFHVPFLLFYFSLIFLCWLKEFWSCWALWWTLISMTSLPGDRIGYGGQSLQRSGVGR